MLLPQLELTAGGRPRLQPGEFEHAFLDKADLQFEDNGGTSNCLARRHDDGHAILTNHRIIWVDAAKAPSPGASCYVPLSTVDSIELSSTKRWSHTKLRLRVHTDHMRQPVSRQQGYTEIREVRIISSRYGTFGEKAHAALHERSWEKTLPPSVQALNPLSNLAGPPALAQSHANSQQYGQPGMSQAQGLSGWLGSAQGSVDAGLLHQLMVMGFSENRASRACTATSNTGVDSALQWLFEHESDPSLDAPHPSGAPAQTLHAVARARPQQQSQASSVPGIAGILKREQEIAARNDRVLDEAFQDLRGLMAKAQEMVQLAEKFRGTLNAKDAPDPEALDSDMQQQLIEIGIASPVTKELAGAQYHKQLSKQLADFLAPRMERAGGIITLADVYCLFNRARGTELISPDDLLQAVTIFTKIGAPMYLRTFTTGVLVVQSNSHSDDEICARIAEMVVGEGCGPAISATHVAAALSVPLTIAAQHLATAESKAVLCRDDGPEGLRFFRNFFEELPGS